VEVCLCAGAPGDFLTALTLRAARVKRSLTFMKLFLFSPGSAGPVSADHLGPRPYRKHSSCFTWKTAAN